MARGIMSLLGGIALLQACSLRGGQGTGAGGASGAGDTTGGAGTGAAGTTSAAGTTGTGAAGTTGTGAAGTTGTGAAGTTGTGAAGTSGASGTAGGTGAAGANGSAGSGAGGRGGGGGQVTGAAGTGGRGGATGTAGTSGSAGTTGSAGTGGATSSHWVGTWTGAPQLTETSNLPPATLTNATLRQVVHVSLGGSQIRVRFSNEFGNGSVTINQAHVAVCKATPVDSTIDTSTDKALAFSGMPSVTIAQGQAVWSDPLDFTLAPLSNLTVTVAFGTVPSNVTGHPGSRTTSYEQTGSSTVTSANMSSAQTADHWYILSGVDVMADAASRGIAILGDSITDGRGSTTNGNDRWPDDLARLLQANGTTTKVAVMNQGIGGNAVVSGGLGPTAQSRYMRDILGQSGVRWVIIFEGVNDIGGGASASAITSVFDQFISMAHAQNLLVYGATITPFGANSYYSVTNEAARQAVNTYVRSGKFDAFIDFDAAVTDGGNPPKLQVAYDSGDGLHLTPAGYQKLASTVSLALFGN
jgi:lysophospholipase L1-like esterase